MRKREREYGEHFLQSSARARLLECSYFLKVVPVYKVWMQDCSGAPKILVPITLAPALDDEFNIVYAPSFMIPEGQALIHEE